MVRAAVRSAVLGLVSVLTVTGASALAQAGAALVFHDMEDTSGWRTGGQREAALTAERTVVKQGKQALRFDVKIDFKADESIEGKQYPKGWPRIEWNLQPSLDLSMAGGLAFDLFAQSTTRTAMPGSALHVILRDASKDAWSANLGQLPINEWKHFRLDFSSFTRSSIVHCQFFLCEDTYNDADQVSFIIDDLRVE